VLRTQRSQYESTLQLGPETWAESY
jgi:hypothetical protein